MLTFLGGGVLVLAVAGGAWALFGRGGSEDDDSAAIGPKVPSVTATKPVAGPVVPGKTTAPRPSTSPASVKPSATAAPTQAPVAKPSSTAAPTPSPTKAAATPTQAPAPVPTKAPVSTPPVTAPQQGGTVAKKAFTFKVARGDTLWGLTEKALAATGRSTSNANIASFVTKLAAANPDIVDPDLIYLGQTITWPAGL